MATRTSQLRARLVSLQTAFNARAAEYEAKEQQHSVTIAQLEKRMRAIEEGITDATVSGRSR